MKQALLLIFITFFINHLGAQSRDSPLNYRLRSNLYIKVQVNKSECYVGEPIIATYKLYSAFESVSTILKSPSFYGFSFKDIVSPQDNVVSREVIDGTKFDVHTIKKVQLTPNEAGQLEVDELTMGNKIKVLNNDGSKLPILYGLNDYTLDGNYMYFTVSSVPIIINVLSPAVESKPVQYNGAAGDFRMNIQLSKMRLQPGEEGLLTITIAGQGDFSKITQPVVNWPAGIETQTAKIKDSFTMGSANASGYKVFGIPFSGAKPGSYTITPIQFSYYDANANRHNTITNSPIEFYIDASQQRSSPIANIGEAISNDKSRRALLIGGSVLAALLLLLFLARRRNSRVYFPKHTIKNISTIPTTQEAIPTQNLDEYFRPAADTRHHIGNTFYSFLKLGIVKFFEEQFALPAVLFSRISLKQSMTDNHIAEATQIEVLNLLTEIEMNIYSGGGLDADKTALLNKAKNILGKL